MYFYLPHMTFSVHIRFSILYWYRTMNAPDGASCHLFFISHFCCYVLFAEVIRRHTHKLRTGSKPEGKVHNHRMKTFTVRILSYKQPKKKIIMHQNTFLHILYSVMPSDSAKKRRSASKNSWRTTSTTNWKPPWRRSKGIWKPCWPTRTSTPESARTFWKRAPRRPDACAACWPTSRP